MWLQVKSIQLSDTSKLQSLRVIELPFLRLDPGMFEFRPKCQHLADFVSVALQSFPQRPVVSIFQIYSTESWILSSNGGPIFGDSSCRRSRGCSISAKSIYVRFYVQLWRSGLSIALPRIFWQGHTKTKKQKEKHFESFDSSDAHQLGLQGL